MRNSAIPVLLVCLSLAACSGGTPQATASPSPGAMSTTAPGAAPTTTATHKVKPVSETLRQLRESIGSAPCTDSSQCRTVAVGAKACGGPDYYLAFSIAHTRPEQVGALAQRYREQRLAANAASGEMSTCQLTTDPGATCQPAAPGQRSCVLGLRGASSPPGDAR